MSGLALFSSSSLLIQIFPNQVQFFWENGMWNKGKIMIYFSAHSTKEYGSYSFMGQILSSINVIIIFSIYIIKIKHSNLKIAE
jgi:hypothetical protein